MLQTTDRQKIADILKTMPAKLVLSSPADKAYLYRKTVIQKIDLKGEACYQLQRFTDRQAFHENIRREQLEDAVLSGFPEVYTQLNIFGSERQWDFKLTKKGRLLSDMHGTTNTDEGQQRANAEGKRRGAGGSRRITAEGEPILPHNRKKNYILKEGTVIPPLTDLGIFTKDGKVVQSMYDKYKQINRFLEMVEDVIKNCHKPVWHIIDFGCGKSYLTFILYYYLVEVKGLSVQMTGLDLKADVIAACNATAKKYGYDSLHFEMGDINGYQADTPVDMVITLHACDTATDYAIYNAIEWKADIILSVPCCQHEVNGQIASDNFSLLTRYGIVKERVSALMTDAIRGNVLTYCGYRTQLLEFVDFAASPKNVLIRAVRGRVSEEKRQQAKEEVERLCREFGIRQTLAGLLFWSHTES